MDKILITTNDIDQLYEWRDKNLDLVLKCPCPLKGVEIHVKPCEKEDPPQFYIRCIREKTNRLRLYLGTEGERASGYFLLEQMADGRWLKLKDTIEGDESRFTPSKKEFGDSMVALYCSLMAIMVYSSDIEFSESEIEEEKEKKSTGKKAKKSIRKHGHTGVTYILRQSGKTLSVGRKGSHASPKGIFTVRGHYRHLNNGNVIWVSEYKKGTGKNKTKTYKIGRENKNEYGKKAE